MGDTGKPGDGNVGNAGANGVGDDSRFPTERFPWMQPVNEDVAVEMEGSGPGLWLISAGVVVVVLFSAFMYYIYTQGQELDVNQEIPIIKADEAPVRVEPEVSGGIDIPHQERLVFDRVTGETTPVENNVRSAPEEPLSLESPSQTLDAPQQEADVSAPVDETAPDVSAPNTGAPAVPDEAMFTPKGRYLVQVGAFSSLDAADKFWSGLQAKYPMILKGLSDEVQRAEIGARVLYRLRVGYLMTRGEADRVCSDLKSRGQDCMVVNPK